MRLPPHPAVAYLCLVRRLCHYELFTRGVRLAGLTRRTHVQDRGRCERWILPLRKCTHDYLQDTLALAKKFARDEFGVPEDAWHASTPAA